MSGLEHSLAPIELRERLSFTRQQTAEIAGKIRSFPNITGCVLISTCNRTELYLSCAGQENPGELLCRAAGAAYAPYRDVFVNRAGKDAVAHLMAVAAGLRSRIFGEDQILSQVRTALVLARQAGAADPVLETLFRSAVCAGKEVRTKVCLTSVPTSAASMAVALLQKKLGNLRGKSALVIGNGEMGRLAATLLLRAGCRVTVTLRTYRHGQTVVPPGCGVVPYEERFRQLEGCDILLSATTSPHYTVTAEQLRGLSCPPPFLVDLAIPRDIQPEAGQMAGVSLYNIDDLGSRLENRAVPPQAAGILRAQTEQFYRWLNYRDCIPAMESLKRAAAGRLRTAKELQSGLSEAEIVELSVNRTVELLIAGLAEHIRPEDLVKCESKIRLHTTGKPVVF